MSDSSWNIKGAVVRIIDGCGCRELKLDELGQMALWWTREQEIKVVCTRMICIGME